MKQAVALKCESDQKSSHRVRFYYLLFFIAFVRNMNSVCTHSFNTESVLCTYRHERKASLQCSSVLIFGYFYSFLNLIFLDKIYILCSLV